MRTHDDASKKHGPEFEKRVLDLLLDSPSFSKVRKATRDEQRKGHFDIFAEMTNGRVLKVECKSIKDNDDGMVVIEGRTVCDRDGVTHPGWLFGAASHIAFERSAGRITWVKLSALREYVEAKGIDWWATPSTKKTPGVLYTRTHGREYDPMVNETVICAGMKLILDTRGDRMVSLPMAEIERLKGVYTS
jgi:hypothetical protein